MVWDLLRAVVDAPRNTGAPGGSGAPSSSNATNAAASGGWDVVDVGGGTGGFAVPLAALGHRVTVVDPSPDALASLQRRAGELAEASSGQAEPAGPTETAGGALHLQAVQGDAVGLLDVVDAGSADLVLCHGVLEHLDHDAEVAPALAALVAVLRPGGTLSLVVTSRHAAVVARAVAGRFAEAQHVLDDPHGRWGAGDPLPRRFTEPQLVGLLDQAGLQVEDVHGIRTVADLVPGVLLDSEPGSAEALVALEVATAHLPEFRALATQLHVRATRR